MTVPTSSAEVRVSIRRDELDGTIIDAGPDSVLGVQPVNPVDGVQVWVDPLDPARLVRVSCVASDESGWFLDELLGHGAATAINVARETGGRAAVRPTRAYQDVGRLGLLLWLEDCSPLPLDQGLLDAEIASAMRGFPGAVTQVHVRAAAALPSMVALAGELADGSVQPPPALARVAFAVAGTLLGSGSPDEEQTRALVRLASAARSADSAIPAAVDIDDELLALFDSAAVSADWDASWSRANDVEQRFSVDWRVVPRGVLDTREGTIRVRRSHRGPSLLIEVAATRGAPEVPLFARILPGDGADPVAVTRLRPDLTTASYRAVLPVGALSNGDRVDVFSASASVAPLRGRPAEQQAAALRCAARAFSAMRLAEAAPTRAQALWRSSADEWTEWLTAHAMVKDATAVRDRDVALSALARCQRSLALPAVSRTLERRADPRTEPAWTDRTLDLTLAEGRLLGLV